MIILAIETSCDDTGIAILEIKGIKNPIFDVLSSIVSSQVEIHKKYGGVYPMMAKREHQRNLLPVLIRALKESKLFKKSKIKNQKSKIQIKNQKLEKILEREQELLQQTISFLKKYQKPKIDAIAVTVGPGLEPCLWVGVNFAKALSCFWEIPVIPVNHIEAHIIANWLPPIISKSKIKNQKSKIIFPAVCLVTSGGHTQLILMEKPASAKASAFGRRSHLRPTKSAGEVGKYKILGETRDDAAGECFDKTARILGLGYPGGPAIAAEAAKLRSTKYENTKNSLKLQTSYFKIHLPRPMINSKDYDFSFSGLKTAVLYQYQKSKMKNQKYKRGMAKEIQQAIIDVLLKKTIRAAKNYGAKSIILGGGVAANQELRKQFQERIKKEVPNTKYLIPNTKYSTDNAAMVAVAGYFGWLKKRIKNWKTLKAEANLRISD